MPADTHDRWTEALAPARATGFDPGFADRVMHRIGRSDRAPVRRVRRPTARVLAIAASIAILVLSWNGLRERQLTASPGAVQSAHVLPDGTTATLSPGSTLRYRHWPMQWLPTARVVGLRGEAFFDVTSSGRPFEVRTFNGTVEVTGTRFNVRAWPGSDETVVALEEGAVLLRSATGKALPLRPGEVARVGSDDVVRTPDLVVAEESDWRSGALVFRNRPLADVLRALERRYDVVIQADGALVDGRRTTYINPAPAGPDSVLDAVAFALGLRFTRTANGFRLLAGTPN